MELNQQRFSRFSGVGVKSHTSSPLFSSSGMSISSRSTLQIASSDYTIDTYGIPYPVQVNEALTFGKNSVVSVSCSNNGYAWAVFGRKLFVWQYKELKQNVPESAMTPRRTLSGQCRILTLPHCDIGHKADLVTVFLPEGNQMASCLASSPAGELRYWPSIAHDGASIDESGILDGQEFDQLLNLTPFGYLLVTTTCNLVLLQLQHSGGRQVISHRIIKPPSGFFGGIGRKFASIVGFNNATDKENKLIKVCSEKINSSEYRISVLADRFLQEWTINDAGDTFAFEDSEILRKVQEFYHTKVWNSRDISEIKLWLLDMQTLKGNIIMLTAAVNLCMNAQIEYAMLIFSQEGETIRLASGYNLRCKGFYNDENMKCDMKFIINRGMAYVYDDKVIYPVFITGSEPDESEKIELKSPNDKVLAAAVVNGLTLIFSRNHGVISITPSDFDPAEFINSSVSPEYGMLLTESSFSLQTGASFANIANLSMYEYNPAELTVGSNDIVNHLKSAFLYHVKRDSGACERIIESLIGDNLSENQIDNLLDRAVITIAKDMANDVPAKDPRWQAVQGEETYALGSSKSVQILQQLKDKNVALTHFIDFLHATGVWSKLGSIKDHGNIRSTAQVLSDVNEKIVAAIALKSIHTKHQQITDDAIEIVLKEKKHRSIENLTNQDLFYVDVLHIQDIFHAFVRYLQTQSSLEGVPTKLLSTLIEIDALVMTMLFAINDFRSSNRGRFEPPTEKINQFEYLPWTNITGKHGAYDPLIQLINHHLKANLKSVGAPDIRQKCFLLLAEMIDFMLASKERYLSSIKDGEKRKVSKQKYENFRGELITPFVDNEQYELATRLGEKYLDFQVLVLIADRTNNQAKLTEYNEKFKDYNFAQFAINWHLRQNKHSTIFERFKNDQPALTEFLGDHPSLAWIQHIMNGQQGKASHILFALAQNEKELIERKKTLLSLAKLAAFASDSELTVDIGEINAELVLIQHQDSLSPELLLGFGYDINHQKVLTPEEIINLYISEENVQAGEEDFRKALELLKYVENPEDCQIKIWCAAILKDDWTDYNVDSPLDKMQNMIFFKLIDLCHFLDGDLDTFLPPMEYLVAAPELERIKNDQKFLYLLKFGYEHVDVYRSKNINEEF